MTHRVLATIKFWERSGAITPRQAQMLTEDFRLDKADVRNVAVSETLQAMLRAHREATDRIQDQLRED